jgi:hypothetical protein
MAKGLLITTRDLKKFSILTGNLDDDKFIQYVAIAQDIHIKNYLGTDLLEKIQADIVAGTLSGVYLTLVNTFVKPMLIHWAMVEYLPFAAYTISEKGVLKHNSETSQSVDKNEIDFLIEKERNIAESYTNRFIDYMCYNSTLFPEYTSNTNDDVQPSKDSDFGGWVLNLIILLTLNI